MVERSGGSAPELPHPVRVFSAPLEQAPSPSAGRLRVVARTCAGLAGIAAAVGLAGWILDVPALERLAPGLATMKFNTAVCLLLLAVSFFVPPLARATCAVVAGLVATVQLLEYAVRSGLGVDQLVVTDHGSSAHPGRTSMAAAIALLAIALARGPHLVARRRLSQLLALVDIVIAALALLGYVYDVHSLYTIYPFASVALHTAIALLLLGVASIAAAPRSALLWIIDGDDPGSDLLRYLVPLTVLGLPVIGFLCLRADTLGWVNGVATVTLVVALCTIVVGVVSWTAARRLAGVDRHRQVALQDLTELKHSLERQVVERAGQLQSRRDEIAVLEDRQRIAADLHDIVIQRLFAAGMFLQGTDDDNPSTRRRIDTAVESMDIAIKDLRASIFELGSGGSSLVDLATALDEICIEAARVLGFRPELTVDDPDAEAETVRDDLLAVLRESLSNVHRHAGASAVDVVLRTGTGLISLTVTDDGAGISAPPHSSGTRNMAERARQHGGDCVWTTVDPHGTRVWWHVPGTPPILGAPPELEDDELKDDDELEDDERQAAILGD